MKKFTTVLAIFLACCALLTSASAGVYKHVNPDGSIEFTDVPQKIGEDPVEVPPASSYTPPPTPKPAAPTTPTVKQTAVSYESVSITSPAHDSTVRDNEGNISISIGCKPGLQKGHGFLLMMDDKQVGKGAQNTFQLKNIDRGSHTFIVQVIDENDKMIIQSTSVTVHLHRASVNRPRR